MPVFVLFCLGSILLLISFKPSIISFKKSKEPGKKIHVVVDNSASMQGSINKEDLAILVSKLATRLSSVNVVSLSTSDSYDVYKYSDLDSFIETLKSSNFSRKGFKLGRYISKIMRVISETDQVVLVSDGDKYSWDDFDWKALEGQVPIRLKLVKSDNQARSNVYFKNIVAAKSDGLIDNSWDVLLSRTDTSGSDSVTIRALVEGKVVFTSKGRFQAGQETITISANIPLSNILKDEKNTLIKWEVLAGSKSRNMIQVDDAYYQPVKVQLSKVLLLTLPYGELLLEDPSYHIQKTLDVLGFKVRELINKFDRI